MPAQIIALTGNASETAVHEGVALAISSVALSIFGILFALSYPEIAEALALLS